MLNGIGAAATGRHSFVINARVAVVGVIALLVTQQASAAYEVLAVTNGGTIDGIVTLSGTAPEARIKVSKNQDYCGQTIPDPAYTVDSSGGVANVIVYLKDISKGKAAPSEPLALVYVKCMFSPRAQGAMALHRMSRGVARAERFRQKFPRQRLSAETGQR
jgi:hypothetical protein